MGFEYLTNIPLEQAKKDYLRKLRENGFGTHLETVPVQKSYGRVTSRAVYARINAPHYAASAMDGVALRAKDSFGATETTPVTLRPDQFTVVDTGDPIPEDCDAVIMVEDIVKNDDGSITIHAAAAPWQHIRQIGEDICAGEMILPSFMEITPAAIGAMIAGGVLELEVIRRPVVGIIPTGDEIVPPCADPKAKEGPETGYRMDCPDGPRRMLLAPGVAGALKEHTCPPYWRTYRDAAHTFEGRTLYDSWRRTGNLRGAYFGHDHMNTFDGTDANGIRLGMTKCCTFGSYNDNNIGVRVFTVRPDGTYATSIFAEADC